MSQQGSSTEMTTYYISTHTHVYIYLHILYIFLIYWNIISHKIDLSDLSKIKHKYKYNILESVLLKCRKDFVVEIDFYFFKKIQKFEFKFSVCMIQFWINLLHITEMTCIECCVKKGNSQLHIEMEKKLTNRYLHL